MRSPRSAQAPEAVVLVRPHRFRPNPETADDNAFQRPAPTDVADAAFAASTDAARILAEAGVRVHLFDDETVDHPDSVFPNNWFSTHADGRIAVYPMRAVNRRGERRSDIVDFLRDTYRVREIVDYSDAERAGRFLEGTGAMVLDHIARVAYTARSQRADPSLLARFCTDFGYRPMLFDAVDRAGRPIYHTNVMMCVATDFALVGLEAIPDLGQRKALVERLERSGRTVVPLTLGQLGDFAGNAIELQPAGRRRILAMSVRAAGALTARQRTVIEESCDLVPLEAAPIELAGGSVRCMIAGIHLPRRSTVSSITIWPKVRSPSPSMRTCSNRPADSATPICPQWSTTR